MQKKDFKIENKIYSEKAIKDSIKDFTGFGIKYSKSKISIEGDSNDEIEGIFNELMNYVIGIQNETI